MFFLLIISWKWFIGLVIIIFPSMFFFSLFNIPLPIKEINGNYRISKVIPSGYIIDDNYHKILLKSKSSFNIDDLINVQTLNVEDLTFKKEKYSYYLRSLGVKYLATNVSLSKVNNKTSIRSKIINYFLKGPNFYVKYISLILIGKKNDLNKELYEKIKHISILHLFVISGFHINLLMSIILFFLKKLKLKNTYRNLIGFLIILMYLYLLNFSLSSLRAFLFLLLCFVNKKCLKNKFQKIDILTFLMLLMFAINPFVIFSISFIFTYLITFSILFVSDIKNKKIKVPLIMSFAYLSSIVISIYISGVINIFGFINSIVFSPITIINYVVSLFCFPFKNFLNYYYIFIDSIINIFYRNSVVININIDHNFVNIYYLSLFLVLSIIKHYIVLKDRNLRIHKSLSLIKF